MNDECNISVNDHTHLSALRPADKTALVEYLNDREIYEHTLCIPHPYSEEDAIKYLATAKEATNKHGHPIHFAIRDESERIIGSCGFDDLRYGHRAEIGYWLAKPFWGRGITTDVVRAVCKFAFAEWKLVRITALVFVFNDASAGVLEKSGFVLEGVLRKHDQKDGKFIDTKLYALVKG